MKTVAEAHAGSVLSLSFELGAGGKGKMVTGSSDATAGVWDIQWGVDEERGTKQAVKVDRVGTLRGHDAGVLDVVLGRERIVTG